MKLSKILIIVIALVVLLVSVVGCEASDIILRVEPEPIQETGYDLDGYDKEGFNKEGFDIDGYSRDGFHKETMLNREGYHVDHKWMIPILKAHDIEKGYSVQYGIKENVIEPSNIKHIPKDRLCVEVEAVSPSETILLGDTPHIVIPDKEFPFSDLELRNLDGEDILAFRKVMYYYQVHRADSVSWYLYIILTDTSPYYTFKADVFSTSGRFSIYFDDSTNMTVKEVYCD